VRLSRRRELGITTKEKLYVILAAGIFLSIIYTYGIEDQGSASPSSESGESSSDLESKIKALSNRDRRAVSIYIQAILAQGAILPKYKNEAMHDLEPYIDKALSDSGDQSFNRNIAYALNMWALRAGLNDDPAIVRAKQMLSDLDVQ